jgi:hypothetical protein
MKIFKQWLDFRINSIALAVGFYNICRKNLEISIQTLIYAIRIIMFYPK